MLDDQRGNFWFSSAQGLFRVSKAELKEFAAGRLEKIMSVDYGVKDGMKTRAFNLGNQPAAWKARDGSLLFCSLKGVVVVAPAGVKPAFSLTDNLKAKKIDALEMVRIGERFFSSLGFAPLPKTFSLFTT